MTLKLPKPVIDHSPKSFKSKKITEKQLNELISYINEYQQIEKDYFKKMNKQYEV